MVYGVAIEIAKLEVILYPKELLRFSLATPNPLREGAVSEPLLGGDLKNTQSIHFYT